MYLHLRRQKELLRPNNSSKRPSKELADGPVGAHGVVIRGFVSQMLPNGLDGWRFRLGRHYCFANGADTV